MEPIDPTTQGQGPADETRSLRRQRTVRLLVPVAVAGLAAGTIGLVPALADSSASDPDLPKITAEQLVAKLAGTEVDAFSGTVKIKTDLGLPGLIAGGASKASGGPFGPGPGDDDRGGDPAAKAAPQAKLTQLLSGTHTLRVATDGQDRQRLSVIDETSEYSLIRDGEQVWAYDTATNQVFHATADKAHAKDKQRPKDKHRPEGLPSTPQEAAEQALAAVDPTTSVTVDGTSSVAGRDAYDLLVTPKQSDSTVGSIRIAVDAENGAPLKFTLTPRGSERAAVDIGFTDVGFDTPDADQFRFTPPKGATVTEADDLRRKAEKSGEPTAPTGLDLAGLGLNPEDVTVHGEGWQTVLGLKLPAELLSGEAMADLGKDKKAMPEGFDPKTLLNSLGDRVKGDFGGGTVITSRLVNVLITDDGAVYAGAVTKDALVEAAEK